MSETLTIIITAIITGLMTGSTAWIFTIKTANKKAKVEVHGAEIDNANKIVEMWEKLNVNNEKRIAELEKKICLKESCKERQQ